MSLFKGEKKTKIFIAYLLLVFFTSVILHEYVHVYQTQQLGLSLKEIRILDIGEHGIALASVVAYAGNYTTKELRLITEKFENEAYSIQTSYIFVMLVAWHYFFRKKLY